MEIPATASLKNDQLCGRLSELAALPPSEYDQVRKQHANELGMRVSTLDALVHEEKARSSKPKRQLFESVDTWPQAVNGAALAEDILAEFDRHCVMSNASKLLISVYVMFTWCQDAFDVSPLLALVSPEKRCGKTTALTLISMLAHRPIMTSNITSAALTRTVDAYGPTLLIDESDTFLNAVHNSDLRGILNGGHTRQTAVVFRTAGENFEPQAIHVFCPKVIAMIGRLPGTLEDRSIVIPLRRKTRLESVDRLRLDRGKTLLPLRRKLKRWSTDNRHALRLLDPDAPHQLGDRAQDNARPLLAIAERLGNDWEDRVRLAFTESAAAVDNKTPPDGIQLLSDIRSIFEELACNEIGSAELHKRLVALEEAPWAEFDGERAISTRRIASMLKRYDIASRRRSDGRYYALVDFRDAFSRYL